MSRELITFEAAGEVFGLDSLAIREIRAWTPATQLPDQPPYVVGVVNLRGTMFPVIDLAARLGWNPVEATPRHAIIVIRVKGQDVGLLVEAVSDIITVADDAFQATPAFKYSGNHSCLQSLVSHEDRIVLVLDPLALGADIEMLEQVGELG
jgi:purine-binding chemotaxis protein CheW